MKRVYLDYAATTPVDPAVERAMRPYWSRIFGNPSSLHQFGQEAARAVYHARKTIARAIGTKDEREIIFTGSATEANNLALRGVVAYLNQKSKIKIITSVTEHQSILETGRDLENQGVEMVYLPVNRGGLVDLEKLKAALDERTVLVSVQYANSEIGVIQPITKISEIIRTSRAANNYPLFHTDAVQAFQFLDCDVNNLGVDLMTLSAHKIYGPKGIGALYIRSPNPKPHTLTPIITGGGQEFGLRSGTENVPAIVGFAEAVKIATIVRKKETGRLQKLRDYLWRGLKKKFPKAEINGSLQNRLPNNLNVYLPGKSAQDWCVELDLSGIAVSPGTACSAYTAGASPVIRALGYSEERAKSSVRFSLGRPTTKSELDRTLIIIKNLLT